MADANVKLNESESYLVARAIEVKLAQLKRAFNAADNDELKAVYSRQVQAYMSLLTKFPG